MSKIVLFYFYFNSKTEIINIDLHHGLAKEYQRFTIIQLSLKGFRVKICCKGTQDNVPFDGE